LPSTQLKRDDSDREAEQSAAEDINRPGHNVTLSNGHEHDAPATVELYAAPAQND
jgi:hypothetical protein